MADATHIPIFFNSSMPRSGSTLLQNLLMQSSLYHCTPTSDLLDVLVTVRDKWMQLPNFIAQGLDCIQPRITSALRHTIRGFYLPEFTAGKTVFDKSRGHLSQIELLEEILRRPVKIVVTVRDVRDVVASFEKLWRKSRMTDHPPNERQAYQNMSVAGRAEKTLEISGTTGFLITSLRDVFARGLGDRLVIVPYRELTWNPTGTIKRVLSECGLPPFQCDPMNVVQRTREDDSVHGMKLHSVGPVVKPDQGMAWDGILSRGLADSIHCQYADIQELAGVTN